MKDQTKETEVETVDILEVTLNNTKVTLGSVVDVINQLDKDSINPELVQDLAETSDEYIKALKAYIKIVQDMSK